MENALNGASVSIEPPDTDIEPNTGLTWGRIREQQRRAEAAREAGGDPAPGPLVDAFLPEPLEHLGVKLRELVWYDIILLKKIDSPLFRRFKQLGKPAEERQPVTFTDEEGFEMIYHFTHPEIAVAKEILKGRDAFRELATKYVLELAESRVKDQANSFPEQGAFVGKLVELCVSAFVRSLQTHVKFGAASGEGDPKSPPAGTRTGSAGGSPTSPSSSGTSA